MIIYLLCVGVGVSSYWTDTYTCTFRIYAYKHDAIDTYVSIIVIDIIVIEIWNGMRYRMGILLYYMLW